MNKLTAQLAAQFAESAKLESEGRKNLAGLGFALVAPPNEEASA